MEVDYYSKYLKYKSKYLELKKQIGGNECKHIESRDLNGNKSHNWYHYHEIFDCKCNVIKEDGTKCNCTIYIYNDDYGKRPNLRYQCANCKHSHIQHGVTNIQLKNANIEGIHV